MTIDALRKRFSRIRMSEYTLTDLNKYCTVCGAAKIAVTHDQYGHKAGYLCPIVDYHYGLEKHGIMATSESPVTVRACPACLWKNWHDANYCGRCCYELQKPDA